MSRPTPRTLTLRTLPLIALALVVAGAVAACNPWASPQPRTPMPPPITQPDPQPDPAPPDPPLRPARTGPVRLEGRAFADDQGPWNPLGASLFWALWGERHDPGRLDANLAYLAAADVDYVRVLAMVGTPSWADRAILPDWPDYWAVVDRLFARLGSYGLRAQVVLFADAQVVMPDEAAREHWVDQWAAYANQHRARIQFLEVANEPWQNGFPTAAPLHQLGHRLSAQTDIPVALGAPPDDQVVAWLAGWTEVGTLHYDRAMGDEGLRPIRQPWGAWGEYRERAALAGVPNAHTVALPQVAVNNEPIGPQSSGAGDQDPARLALAYLTSFIAGNAAYVYHAGAGIRGGGAADLAGGRLANLYEYPPELLAGISHWRRRLPPGLANWTRANAQWAEFPWDGSQRAVDQGQILRAYVTTQGDQLVGVLLGPRAPHEGRLRRGVNLAIAAPQAPGPLVSTIVGPAGASVAFPAGWPGLVITGTIR